MTKREAYKMGKRLGGYRWFRPNASARHTSEYQAVKAAAGYVKAGRDAKHNSRTQDLWDSFFAGVAAGVKARDARLASAASL